jgi:hypothetical protein
MIADMKRVHDTHRVYDFPLSQSGKNEDFWNL